jgi:hypothetical protein
MRRAAKYGGCGLVALLVVLVALEFRTELLVMFGIACVTAVLLEAVRMLRDVIRPPPPWDEETIARARERMRHQTLATELAADAAREYRGLGAPVEPMKPRPRA